MLDDVLSPAESGQYIMEKADFIGISSAGVERVARLILNAVKDDSIKKVAFAAHVLHPKTADKEAVQWVFFLDTINFSFWPDEGQKFDVSYKGISYTGYFAACAAVNKALDAGIPVTSAEWMANCTKEQLDNIFVSDSGHVIPLVDERVRALNESGSVLLEKFGGLFYNVCKQAEKSAQKLLQLIVQNFTSFRDFALFKGQSVSLLKRAQILVADVYGALTDHDPIVDMSDIGSLTMFADYRVPQALAFLGVLEYSEELLEKLGEGKRLQNGCAEEVELRGASIWACEKIVKTMDDLRATEEFAGLRQVPAMEVDVFIWVFRRQNAAAIEKAVPFHRTRCIYY